MRPALLLVLLLPLEALSFTKIEGLNGTNVLCGYCDPPGGTSTTNDTFALLDEQLLAGSPATDNHKPKIKFASIWMAGWQRWIYPQTFALVDLGKVYNFEAVYASHGSGQVQMEWTIGVDPFTTGAQWRVNTTNEKDCVGWGWSDQWCGWNMSTVADKPTVLARYITIRMINPGAIGEIVVYGTPAAAEGEENPASPLRQVQAPPGRPAPLWRTFVGTNAFVTDPLERLVAVGSIREYHDWQWVEPAGDPGFPHALNSYQPSQPGFRFDDFYNTTRQAGLALHQCLQGRAIFLDQNNASQSKWKPLPDADFNDALIPASYVALGAHAYQTAARYGRVKVADSALQLAKGQPRLSGLGLLSHMETMNEVRVVVSAHRALVNAGSAHLLLFPSLSSRPLSLSPMAITRTDRTSTCNPSSLLRCTRLYLTATRSALELAWES
jgi:hypothetical protein